MSRTIENSTGSIYFLIGSLILAGAGLIFFLVGWSLCPINPLIFGWTNYIELIGGIFIGLSSLSFSISIVLISIFFIADVGYLGLAGFVFAVFLASKLFANIAIGSAISSNSPEYTSQMYEFIKNDNVIKLDSIIQSNKITECPSSSFNGSGVLHFAGAHKALDSYELLRIKLNCSDLDTNSSGKTALQILGDSGTQSLHKNSRLILLSILGLTIFGFIFFYLLRIIIKFIIHARNNPKSVKKLSLNRVIGVLSNAETDNLVRYISELDKRTESVIAKKIISLANDPRSSVKLESLKVLSNFNNQIAINYIEDVLKNEELQSSVIVGLICAEQKSTHFSDSINVLQNRILAHIGKLSLKAKRYKDVNLFFNDQKEFEYYKNVYTTIKESFPNS